MEIVFQIAAKYSNKIVLVPSSNIFVDFKYDTNFCKFKSRYTQIKHFWSQIQRFLLLYKSLHFDRSEGTDFFNIAVQKLPNNVLSVPNWNFFLFAWNFVSW